MDTFRVCKCKQIFHKSEFGYSISYPLSDPGEVNSGPEAPSAINAGGMPVSFISRITGLLPILLRYTLEKI